MPLILLDRVKETTTTTGTGTITLAGAVEGYQSFAAIGNGNTTYYTITDGTDWEVGLGTYTSSGTTLARTQVFESSNSNNAVNWSAGEKEVFVTFPAEATQGNVPSMDGSEISSDLVAWKNLKKYLASCKAQGKSFANPVASTWSIIHTSTSSELFAGTVLAGNQNVYYVPHWANVGQGFGTSNTAASMIAFTYSLLYTTFGAYEGGVLAPNGEIYFVPKFANRGQKIRVGLRNNIIVSTYNLAYSVNSGYVGGVVAPNGDIHFVPNSAVVGQKVTVSATSLTVSTYSLVYTTSTAYAGGCLAPDGSIHFIPYSAAQGQKVASNGTVSTYALLQTGAGQYYGGVMDMEGTIHFVPYNAPRGQKVDINGTVSTYSLPYTIAAAYKGGVLAPDGTIYFTPYSANVGTRISPDGVVSTYSLIITHNGLTYTNNGYCGGSYHPRGFIHTAPQKARDVSTNYSASNLFVNTNAFNKQMCLSPYLNKL